MLAERFKLAVHREVKEMPGLALALDKKGLRIKPVQGDGSSGWSVGPTLVRGDKFSMSQFADTLANSLNRPVKDETGAPGFFNINIEWTPDLPTSSDPTNLPGSVYSAVAELGLRMRVQKIPVEVLVVDHVERVPVENQRTHPSQP